MSVFEKLYEERVASFSLTNDKAQLTVQECCDFYFTSGLKKAEVKQLIDELTAIYNQMEGGED
jgi:hypothetical protein